LEGDEYNSERGNCFERSSVFYLFTTKGSRVILDYSGNINPSMLILKNGRDIWFSENLLTKLEDSDEVSIFPPMK